MESISAYVCPVSYKSRLGSQKSKSLIQVVAFIAISFIAAMGGCSTNLATGERRLNFTSEAQEISMGREADKEISASIGLYADEPLQQYVQKLGTKLASNSERPNLPWTFRVVDDPTVNAFAVPGGFIYVTRGILVHLNNEAELAGVMGHEIGHVTAQHSVHSMATEQLTQLGLGLGSILLPDLQPYMGLAGTGLGLLFLKFSRDDENQADELGVRYMMRAGSDPRQLGEVMAMLDRVSGGEGGRVPEWLATHPSPGNRRNHIEEIIKASNVATGGTINREPYLNQLDGMMFGPNPREGFFRSAVFFHPELKFRFEFPSGWKTMNQKQAVVAVSPKEDAVVVVAFSTKRSVDEAANEFFAQEGLTGRRTGSASIHGMRAASGSFTAQSEQETVQGAVAFVEYNGRIYQLLGYSGQPQWGAYEQVVMRAIGSFDRLTDSAMLSVQPQRLKLVTVPRAMSLDEFQRLYPSDLSLETLALINRVERTGQFRAGQQVKRVVGAAVE